MRVYVLCRCRCVHKTPRVDEYAATSCNTLQHAVAYARYNAWISMLQHAATHCDTLQHAATRCNTLLRMQDTTRG